MRELLFRGKVLETGKWVYGYYQLAYDDILKKHFHCLWDKEITFGFDRALYVDPETVGQYTGLQDKNGVKIFEGDIVAWKQYDETDKITIKSIVTYTPTSFHLRGKDEKGNPDYPMCYPKHRRVFEVIGNIHDNPDPEVDK